MTAAVSSVARGARSRVRRLPCLSSTAAQTMAPHGPALLLIERLQPESETVQGDRVGVYAGSIARRHSRLLFLQSYARQCHWVGRVKVTAEAL